MKILEKHWQQLAWFISSFLLTALISFTSSHVQASTTIVATSPQVVPSSPSNAGSRVAFTPVANSHSEPNFYQ